MEEKIKRIIIEQLGCNLDRVVPEATLEDLNAGSLDLVELILTLEEELTIDIPDEDASKLKTVKDILIYCDAKVSTRFEQSPDLA